MSTYYSIKCLNCNERTRQLGENSNRAGGVIKRFLLNHEAYAALGSLLPDYPIDVFWQMDISQTETIPAKWFSDHRGHRLVAWSEYDEEFDGPCPPEGHWS